MRKLIAPLVVLLSLLGARVEAAPEALRCKAPFDPVKIDRDPASPGWNVNCFADEVFILDGSQNVTITESSDGGQGTQTNRALVDCTARGDNPSEKDSTNCFIGASGDQLKGGVLDPAVQRMFELIRARGVTVPQYEQLVFFRADFDTSKEPGPLFYRAANGNGAGINEVANIGIDVGTKDKPYVGYIDAGNTRGIYLDGFDRPGADRPDTDIYVNCGEPAIGFFPQPGYYPQPAVCSPGLFTYFDALAQATAAMFGPQLRADPSFKADCVALANERKLNLQMIDGQCSFTGNLYTLPALKAGLDVRITSAGLTSKSTALQAIEANIWNSLLDLPGSLMGGNTFRPTGNGSFEVGAPPPFEGVAAPLEGKQRLRFLPIDLYLLGFQSWQAVPPVRSFMLGSGNVRTHITEPAGFDSFAFAGVGPAMGTRISGVVILEEEKDVDTTGDPTLPKVPLPLIPKQHAFSDIVAANGGERRPSYQEAPQFIRQMWVYVTKPLVVMQATARDRTRNRPAEETAEALDEQLRTQTRHLTAILRARRDYARHFYALTTYRGRVYNTFDGSVDDNAYWEFGGARDDAQLFTATGGLTMQLNGPETVPNSGGKIRTVLRVLGTPGGNGKVVFNPSRGHVIRINGDQKGPVPTNVLSLRMRVPNDPDLLDNLRRDPMFEGGYYATVTLEGGPRAVTIRVPRSENAYLVPDGKFRNYAVLLSDVAPFAEGGEWKSFTLAPSNRAVGGLEIDAIRFSHEAEAKDSEKPCAGVAQGPDGWPDAEDNCPAVYNPAQDDGNGDGVGDACEDYDSDQVANACDNCPSLSNSSQRDRDRNGRGDACDPESTEGCFADGSIGGPLRRPSAFGLLAVGLLGLALVWRRRRR
jgi:hypothetical protein